LRAPLGGRKEPAARGTAKRQSKEIPMKGLNQKKSEKKKPAKSMKEKRAEKQAKKAAKGR
jgi:hypothetical protein